MWIENEWPASAMLTQGSSLMEQVAWHFGCRLYAETLHNRHPELSK